MTGLGERPARRGEAHRITLETMESTMKIERLGNKWIIRCLVRGGIVATYSDYAEAVAALRHMRGI